MTRNVRLNDLQLLLLAGAAARDNGSLIPLPGSATADSDRIAKAIASLLRRGLIEELAVAGDALAWRCEEDLAIGLFITTSGREAIGAPKCAALLEVDAGPSCPGDAEPDAASPSLPPKPVFKISRLVGLLSATTAPPSTKCPARPAGCRIAPGRH